MYQPLTKAEAVIDQTREELAHRPRAFFRGLKTLMVDAQFGVLIAQLLGRFDDARDATLAEIPPPTADLPEGDYEDPIGDME